MTMDSQRIDRGSDGTISHEPRGGLLRVNVSGLVELSTITAYVIRHQQIWTEHSRVLWDLRKTDPTAVTSQDLLNIRHAFAEIMSKRRGGRTAVVVSRDLDLVARLTIALSDDQEAPVTIRSFLREKDAISWLNEI